MGVLMGAHKRKIGSKVPSQRQLRVAEEVRHTLVKIFQRGELRDPQLVDVSVTISEVRVSSDLKKALAFVAPLGGGEMEEFLAAMDRARPYIRRRLGQELTLKFVPDISFYADVSFDYAERIDEVLKSSLSRSRC